MVELVVNKNLTFNHRRWKNFEIC